MNSRPRSTRGFTLVEVMVALAITALVAVGAYAAISAASSASRATREAMERFDHIDRTWVLLENDLRNAVARLTPQYYGPPLPALSVEFDSDYRLSLLRGGRANPLQLPRTELARVAYRLADGVLWRDSWYDPSQVDPEQAAQQKLVDGVEEVEIRLLPYNGQSVSAGPWVEEWPGQHAPMALPAAVEVAVTFEDLGEVKRLFEVLPGGTDVPGVNRGGGGGGGA